MVEKVAPAVIRVTGRSGDRGGGGSGFIITSNGYTVINSHVVAGRQELTAETEDDDRVDAVIVGDDPAADLALIELVSSDLP